MSEDKVSWISAAGGAKPGPSAHGCCCPSRLELGYFGHLPPAVGGPGQDTAAAIWGKNVIFPLDLAPVQLRWSLLLRFTFWKRALLLSHPDMSNGSDTLSHPGEVLRKMSAALLNFYFQVQMNTHAVNFKLKDKPQSCPKYRGK